MREWLIILKADDLEAMGGLRARPGLMCARHGEELWLRGWDLGKTVPVELMALPYLRLYELDLEDRLFEPGRLTPCQSLPELNWERISKFISPEMPPSLPPGIPEKQVPIRLRTTGAEKSPDALLVSLKTLQEYASKAPAVRLAGIQFALNAKGMALLMGRPLLPLPGQSFYSLEGMLLPAGTEFEYPLLAPFIGERLNPLRDSLILFDTQGTWQRIPWKNFVKGSRSAILSSGKEASP